MSTIRPRSKTTDGSRKIILDEAVTNDDSPFIKFQFIEGIDELIANNDLSILPSIGDSTLAEIMPRLVIIFNTHSLNTLLDSPPKPLKELVEDIIPQIITPNVLHQFLVIWPPAIDDLKAKALMVYFLDLISRVENNLECLQYLSIVIQTPKWYGDSGTKNSILKGVTLCHRKRKIFKEVRPFWASLDRSNTFHLQLISEGKLVSNTKATVKTATLTDNGRTVEMIDTHSNPIKRFNPVDESHLQLWKDIDTAPFPLFLATPIERPLPDSLLPSLYEALVADDLLVMRTLMHYTVVRVTDGKPFTDAILDIASNAGKVNALLFALAGAEFETPALTTGTVLRSNSHLTTMFKTFYERFGGEYSQKVIKKIVKYVLKYGNIELKSPINANYDNARVMLFTVMKTVAQSGHHISPQMRHFAAVLRATATARFNNRRATFNTLNGFFCLRYLVAQITNPASFDFQVTTEQSSTMLVPFAQLVQLVFNLCPMSSRFEPFNAWNDRLNKTTFPQVMKFVLSIADAPSEHPPTPENPNPMPGRPELPDYPAPSPETLRNALDTIMGYIAKNPTAFRKKYEELRAEQHTWNVAGWTIANFFISFFEENRPCT